ncbi:PREDICTED: UPF0481 [Prunus dulcis]|uniref:PREDICTED: UPF0481 n=2 Tax=Prunus dulcis TaxID=3755 RepID=A0A5E4EET4_PRUDU|nr:PREDICTED: UPF0481 [Prunus dulcis]
MNDKWTMGIADKLSHVQNGSEDLSIYRVPRKLRKVKEDAYNPRVVSIGPLHRDNPNLIAMKEHKWRYMLFILQQTNDFKNTIECLKKCTNAIYGLGTFPLNTKVCESYAEDLTEIKKQDLAEIMLVDGCFMLELFLRYDQYCSDIPLKHQSNDPIFGNAWMIPALKHDLALLENQIPFFILEILYNVIKPHIPHTVEYTPPNSVTSLALNFFQPMNRKATNEDTKTADCKHLLYLLHNFFLQTRSDHIVELGPAKASNQHARKEDTETANSNHLLQLLGKFFLPAKASKKKSKFKYCASDLYDAGVQFEKGLAEDHLLCIKFEDGEIKIPQVFIDDTTDSLFRNLIAFEQCHLKSSHHITSYVILMKSLIRSKEDIKLLKKKEIINENFAGGEYFVHFGSILDHVNPKDFLFGDLCDQVNDYSRSWFHWRKFKVFWMVRLQRYMRSLYNTYFSSPWSITAFFAAAVLFSLTVTQTYYAIHPR